MMKSSVLVLLALCNLLVRQTISHAGSEHCGVRTPPKAETARDQARMTRMRQQSTGIRQLQRLTCDELCDGCITIDVVFHLMGLQVPTESGITQLLPHPTDVMTRFDNRDFPDTTEFTTIEDMTQIIRDNIVVTNEALVGTPFRLNFVEDQVNLTISGDYMRRSLSYRDVMTAELGSQDLTVLDIYLVYTLLTQDEFDSGEDILRVAVSSLPSQQLVGDSDGIWIRYDTLTGGGLVPFDDGVTLTHELGHWLGLYHTFMTEDGSDFFCESSPGDFIDDTPVHRGDSSGFNCRNALIFDQPIESLLPDTCPSDEGRDPVFNYMNYVSEDACHTLAGEFTCQQIERMHYQWTLYRDEVSVCPEGEMEIEFVLEFDKDHDDDNRVILYKDRGTVDMEVIFDSDVDHDEGAFRAQGVLAVDICVPDTSDYEFEITDSASNGFSREGTVSVFQNTVELGSVSGDFGDVYTLEIPALVFDEESDAPSEWPSVSPSEFVSDVPSVFPSGMPSLSEVPTSGPSDMPTTSMSSNHPSGFPTSTPISMPSSFPSGFPTSAPTTPPTGLPTSLSVSPTIASVAPTSGTQAPIISTASPTSSTSPTVSSEAPTGLTPSPTLSTVTPTLGTDAPTNTPTLRPTSSIVHTLDPISSPTLPPTKAPVPVTPGPTRVPFEIGDSVVDIIVDDTELELTMLTEAIAEANLTDTLRADEGVYNVLAPTDEAFDGFAQQHPDLASVLYDDEWIAHLRDLIGFHVSIDLTRFSGVTDGRYRLLTLSGDSVQVTVSMGRVSVLPTIDDSPANFLIQDIEASNGLVSVIDAVLRPDFLTRDMAELTTRFFPALDALFVEVGLDDFILTNFGFTIFVPNGRALQGLNRRRLQTRRNLYSVLASQIVMAVMPTDLIPVGASNLQALDGSVLTLVRRGSRITVNGSTIQTQDILVTNGIAHIVTGLFTAPSAPQRPRPPGPRPVQPRPLRPKPAPDSKTPYSRPKKMPKYGPSSRSKSSVSKGRGPGRGRYYYYRRRKPRVSRPMGMKMSKTKPWQRKRRPARDVFKRMLPRRKD